MYYASLLDCKAVSPDQPINPKQITNISSAFLRYEVMLTDNIHSLVSYTRGIAKNYGVRLIDVC